MEVWECIFLPVHSVFPLFLSCFFFSVSRPGLRPQPSSSISCLCKDPATVVVSIVHVQTPWCRCIRSLLPASCTICGSRGIKGLWDIISWILVLFFQHFLFPLLSKLVLFIFLSSSSCHLESYPDYSWGASFVIFTKIPQCHWGLYSSQRNSDGWEGGITMTIPPHLLPVWLSICQ